MSGELGPNANAALLHCKKQGSFLKNLSLKTLWNS